MIPAALALFADLNNSRGWTVVLFKVPMATVSILITWFLVLSRIARKCSRSRNLISNITKSATFCGLTIILGSSVGGALRRLASSIQARRTEAFIRGQSVLLLSECVPRAF